MIDAKAGIILAVLSAVFNGSFTILFKTKKMADLSINPVIFQLYVSWGVFISSWIVLPFVDLTAFANGGFSTMGIIAGTLFVLATSASFQAIDYIGVALAQGIWGGIAMVVSYIWGTGIFHEVPSNEGLSIFALMLLVIGVLCIAFCENIGLLIRRGSGANLVHESELLLSSDMEMGESAGTGNMSTYIRGITWACIVGIFGGSILAPLHYIPQQGQGLIVLPSFGCGALFASPMILLLHVIYYKNLPIFHWKDACLTGMISGCIYNAGNALSIIACSSIGYGIAYPILQCAILVSGLWGIYLFKEITNVYSISAFFIGGFTLLLGGLLLALSR